MLSEPDIVKAQLFGIAGLRELLLDTAIIVLGRWRMGECQPAKVHNAVLIVGGDGGVRAACGLCIEEGRDKVKASVAGAVPEAVLQCRRTAWHSTEPVSQESGHSAEERHEQAYCLYGSRRRWRVR